MSDALLALEDGTTFSGRSFGARGERFGEAVFNTGMSGYQEVLTDPSYAEQIVVMTAPHVGIYGVNAEDAESGGVQVSGFAVREAARRPSNWRSEGSLADYLQEAGVPGIDGIDTRALTLRIREGGAMRAAISTEDLDPASLVARVRERPGMEGADLAARVSTAEPYEARDLVGPASEDHGRVLRVAAWDWGLKRNILRELAAIGIEATVLPARTPAAAAEGYDGAFFSNGPGDPAATGYAIEVARGLLGRVPLLGICLGHQITALAAGGRSYKLRFGHRGANQPVVDLDTDRVEVTSHNHGFAIDPAGFSIDAEALAALFPNHATGGTAREKAIDAGALLPNRATGGAMREKLAAPPVAETAFGRAALTHWNLNDGALEGMRFEEIPAFCVQYHPEAAPGPRDAAHLFARFRRLMEEA